jgi:hypothetical protein
MARRVVDGGDRDGDGIVVCLTPPLPLLPRSELLMSNWTGRHSRRPA